MIWIQFLATALVIVFAGVRLARYGDAARKKSRYGGIFPVWPGERPCNEHVLAGRLVALEKIGGHSRRAGTGYEPGRGASVERS